MSDTETEEIENQGEGENETKEVEEEIELKIKPASAFKEKYELIKKLGNGAFAEVYLCKDRNTGELFAAKMIDRKASRDSKHLWREIEIQSKLEHPNIIKLYDTFANSQFVMLVLQYAKGGELYDRLLETEEYNEGTAASVVCRVLDSLRYLHSNGIVHRDIKPENILFENENQNNPLLSDFGLSGILTPDSMLYTCAGTPTFMAPEILKNSGYDSSCDIWSLGVLTYVLLSGQLPFEGTTPFQLYHQVLAGNFQFTPEFDNITMEAKDFINKTIKVDPKKRLTLDEAFNHPWIQNNSGENNERSRSIGPNLTCRSCLIDFLKERREKREFKRTTLAVSFVSKLKTLSASGKRKKQKNIIFLIGGPGCGKGTQSERILKDYDACYMSAGELLRNEANSGSELGKSLAQQMKEGKIVPMEVTVSLLQKEIEKQDKKLYLIDGFPRKLDQAELFEEKVCPGRMTIYLSVPDDVLISRLLERSKTSGREDDNVETIKKRLVTFHEVSEVVFDFYKQTGRAVEIDGNRDPDVVFQDVKKAIEAFIPN